MTCESGFRDDGQKEHRKLGMTLLVSTEIFITAEVMNFSRRVKKILPKDSARLVSLRRVLTRNQIDMKIRDLFCQFPPLIFHMVRLMSPDLIFYKLVRFSSKWIVFQTIPVTI